MTGQLTKAQLIPLARNGETPETDQAIELDFNPETLSLSLSAGQESDRGRRGRQQVQHVGRTTATLTFEAIFDNTRPTNLPGPENEIVTAPEQLDVRQKTKKIAELLHTSSDNRNSETRRVQFKWGTIEFNGLIKSYKETLEYFSPLGVPLRSKLSLSIEEQAFRYQIHADQVADAPRPAPPNAPNLANAVAENNDLDSLLDLSAAGGSAFNLDLDLELDLELGLSFDASLEIGLDIDLGVDIDLGFEASAGIELSASASLDLFGGAAIAAGFDAAVDIGAAVSAGASATAEVAVNQPRTAWAPDGPRPGSQAAELASIVTESRALGREGIGDPAGTGAFIATEFAAPANGKTVPTGDASGATPGTSGNGPPGAAATPRTPVPLIGSPPLVAPRFGAPPPQGIFTRNRNQRPEETGFGGRRPKWEQLPPSDGRNFPDRAAGGSGCRTCLGRAVKW